MKKKIMHILSSTQYSGAENIAINIIKSLENEYEFVYVSPEGPIKDILLKQGISYIPLSNNSLSSIDFVIKKWKPDIIHAHDFRASIKVAFSSYQCKKISHIHQNPKWIKNFNIKSFLYLISCTRLDRIVAVSSEILKEAVFSNLIKDKSYVLMNYVNIDAILKAAKETNFGMKFDLAFVGRLTEEKNPLRFIKIVKELTKEKKEISAVMIGDGELRSTCEKLIKNLGLSSNITMMGFLLNPFPVINSSKILIMTSCWEGFGLVAVEAMALGKPVFATPVGGLKSIVNENCGGFCETNKEFCVKIMKALNDVEYYELLSKNAVVNSRKFGDKTKWTEQYKFLYESLI